MAARRWARLFGPEHTARDALLSPSAPALVLAVVAAVASQLAEQSAAQASAGLCLPQDFQRSSSACLNGTRVVRYALSSTSVDRCTDPFPRGAPRHHEPCGCSPKDYSVRESIVNSTCEVSLLAAGCSPPKKAPPKVVLPVEDCSPSKRPCSYPNLRSSKSACQVPPGQEPLSPQVIQQKFVQVVYFFDGKCDPHAAKSIRLPPPERIPCDHQCPAGSYLEHAKCQKCPAGTFSLGGGTRIEYFGDLDPAQFQSTCSFKNSSGVQSCKGWTPRNGRLHAGPYDPENAYNNDDCTAYSQFSCHNSLTASLSTTVELVRDGYVKFAYTVSAEMKYDGLSFYIDSLDEAELGIESSQLQPKEVTFPLEAGVHTLTWIYSKDDKVTEGQDMATISLLEINGTSFSDTSCEKCQPGYHSTAASSKCLPCPMDSISVEDGRKCLKCPLDSYSLVTPRISCTKRQSCDLVKDASVAFSICNATTMKRQVVFQWRDPQICRPNNGSVASVLPKPIEQPCTKCPEGMLYVANKTSGIATCEFCRPGTFRNSSMGDVCLPCGVGEVAKRTLSLQQLLARLDPSGPHDQLPPGFLTGCSGDCGSEGWHAEGAELDSGHGHGPSVNVWLAMEVEMATDGDVIFNVSVDIPAGDTQRGFFFHMDDYPIDQVVDNDYDEEDFDSTFTTAPFIMGPWPLTKGKHRLMWTWTKVHAPGDMAQRDTAIIYDIVINGTVAGGAAACSVVPAGAVSRADKAGWEPCPPGTFSQGGTGNCTKCPANTFSDSPMGMPGSCLPCGPGTSSKPGASECFVGDVAIPNSFCTYKMEQKARGGGVFDPLFYDLSPLTRVHPGQPWGPVYSDPSLPKKNEESMFFVSVCEKDRTNTSCYDYEGQSLNAYACRADRTGTAESVSRPGESVGQFVSLSPLSLDDPRLLRRGLVMHLSAPGCPQTGNERSLELTFVCDPAAGVGEPEAWTEHGKAAAYDPSANFPGWVDRTGPVVPVDGAVGDCKYSMVWYTAFACPACRPSDYEAVALNGCPNNVYITYKYKEPKMCQPNALAPLPRDITCRPCQSGDFITMQGQCKDEKGRRNITHRWKLPRVCNEHLNGSVRLPRDMVVGPCEQTFFLVPASRLSLVNIAFFAAIGLGVLLFGLLSIYNCRKSRSIYEEYSKLVEAKGNDLPEELELQGSKDPDHGIHIDDSQDENAALHSGEPSS